MNTACVEGTGAVLLASCLRYVGQCSSASLSYIEIAILECTVLLVALLNDETETGR